MQWLLRTLAFAIALCSAEAATGPRFALTIDDPAPVGSPLFAAAEHDARIRAALARHGKRAALFVCGMRVDSSEGRRLLGAWGAEGHLLGNHSYSHLYFHSNQVALERYTADIERNDTLLSAFPGFVRVFRFPFLKEGDTVAKREGVRRWLSGRGYRNGHVTVDASDWYVSERLLKRLIKDPNADLAPYRAYYLDHMEERARFYASLADRVLGRPIAHSVLVHHNLLNALFLGDLVDRFRSMGWELVHADEAWADPVYQSTPETLPAGESLVWALAKQTGKHESLLRYPGEDGKYEKDRMDALGL